MGLEPSTNALKRRGATIEDLPCCQFAAIFSPMKKSWPCIKKTMNHGKTCWLVDARVKGDGERRFFDIKDDAEAWAAQQRIRRQNQGEAAFEDRELSSYGWTIADAIRFSLEHLRARKTSVRLSQAIEELVFTKRKSGRSERYCSDLEKRLARLSAAFTNKTIKEITTAELDSFLVALKLAPGTVNTFRRDIRTLWGFAEKRGWTESRIAKNTESATASSSVPGILTLDQASLLLQNSTDPELRAFVAIGLFSGLRVAEIKKLDWAAVDFAGGFIHVSAANSKTRSRRLVPIQPVLAAWLRPVAKTSGSVITRDLRHAWDLARIKVGFGPFFSTKKVVRDAQIDRSTGKQRKDLSPWPENAMRHSFVSYRLAATGDAAKTALESGHDQAVLFRYYRELVQPKVAHRYFNIRPSAAKNVIAMPDTVLGDSKAEHGEKADRHHKEKCRSGTVTLARREIDSLTAHSDG